VTRLPTERLATACWAFIVAKSTAWEAAPMLDFEPLQGANMKNHPQVIHMLVVPLGPGRPNRWFGGGKPLNQARKALILDRAIANRRTAPFEVTGH
jgi:hypothetical protein